MTNPTGRGFTLVELAITLVVVGLLLAFSVPAFQGISQAYQLTGATENVAAQLRLAREKAMATGVEQPIHVLGTTTYQVHYPSGVATTWQLPAGIAFTPATVDVWYRMMPDGRCDNSGFIVLTDRRGVCDTVSIQISGLVLTR